MVNFITNIKISIILLIEKYFSFLKVMKRGEDNTITYNDNEKRNDYGYPTKERIAVKNHKFNRL